MNKYDIIIKEYIEHYETKFKYNKHLIIDAFVKYYGEEHRTVITEKIHNVEFIFIVNCKYLNDYYFGCQEESIHLEEQPYMEEVLSFIGINNRNLIVSDSTTISSNLRKQILSSKDPAATSRVNDNTCNIWLPLFLVDDRMFFHELNHAVTSSILFEKKGIFNLRFSRFGLCNSYTYDNYLLEELINDRSCLDILNNFSELGGNLFGKNELLLDKYSLSFPLIEKFYLQYKDLLNQVRITGDIDYLFQFIDEQQYEKFCKYISKYAYKIIFKDNLTCFEDIVSCINNLVNKMGNYTKQKKKI